MASTINTNQKSKLGFVWSAHLNPEINPAPIKVVTETHDIRKAFEKAAAEIQKVCRRSQPEKLILKIEFEGSVCL